MNLGGNGAVDIEILKKGNHEIEMDSANNMFLWHISNITEEGNAVLSFASEKLVFDEMFPIEIKFDETYSVINA